MMIRSFLPVGQGAFYCERFRGGHDKENINIIYDCGSSTDVNLVKTQIRNTFEKNETIHAVFISHLDEDHINGITYLLQYCKVKKMFFPLITKDNAKYIELHNLIKNNRKDTFAASFLNNPYSAFDRFNIENRPRLYQIRENEQYENEIDAITLQSGEDVAKIIFDDSAGSWDVYKKWLYIPYNFRQAARIIQLKDALNIAFGKNMDNEDLQRIWENGTVAERNAIKSAYHSVQGTFNTNSMTLYSGTEKSIMRQGIYKCCLGYGCKFKAVGCLYTGDYDASGKYKWRDLINTYKLYWRNIGCIQIPHHGSKHSYNPELADFDAFYIISAGTSNRYQHPHSMVIKDLLFKGRFPYVVTEKKVSEVRLLINM